MTPISRDMLLLSLGSIPLSWRERQPTEVVWISGSHRLRGRARAADRRASGAGGTRRRSAATACRTIPGARPQKHARPSCWSPPAARSRAPRARRASGHARQTGVRPAPPARSAGLRRRPACGCRGSGRSGRARHARPSRGAPPAARSREGRGGSPVAPACVLESQFKSARVRRRRRAWSKPHFPQRDFTARAINWVCGGCHC